MGGARKRTTAAVAFLLLVLVLPLIAGCLPRTTVLHHDPAYDYIALKERGLALGGVVSRVAEEEKTPVAEEEKTPGADEERPGPRPEDLLRERLRDREPLVATVPVEAVRKALGDERHEALLESFLESDRLDEEALAGLADISGEMRFLALARIEENEVSPETDPPLRNPWRRVSAAFHVYDLETRRLLWAASCERRIYFDRRSGGGGFSGTFGEGWGGLAVAAVFVGIALAVDAASRPSGPPRPPSPSEVLAIIFAAFARALPRRPGQPPDPPATEEAPATQ